MEDQGVPGGNGKAETKARLLWSIAKYSIQRFMDERAFEAAASIAFFTVFSLFPLLLIVAAVGSFLVDSPQAQQELMENILNLVPVSSEFIQKNMSHILAARGAVGLIGMAGLIWSATSALAVLSANLNRAWKGAPAQSLARSRLNALILLASLVGLLAVMMLARTALPVLARWNVTDRLTTHISSLVEAFSGLALHIFIFIILFFMYRMVPRTRVRWRESLVGAGTSAVVFGVVTFFFTWYLNSGLARYNIVYGSLGALLALLSWVYLVIVTVLYGAHLSAAIAWSTRESPQ
jgi:membrane protein